MAGSVNKVILVGNLGNKPEIRNTQSGDKVASFSLATAESWKDQSGERQTRTEWHKIVVFGGLTKIVENYLDKGSKVFIEGQLRTRKWQNNQGQDVYTTEIVLTNFNGGLTMLDSAGGQQSNNTPQEQGREYDTPHGTVNVSASQTQDIGDLDDEIPF